MTTTTHPLPTEGATQCDLILTALRAAKGDWVTMWDLYEASGAMAVHSRIADLRKRGHQIDQWSDSVRSQRSHRLVKRSHYKLTHDAEA